MYKAKEENKRSRKKKLLWQNYTTWVLPLPHFTVIFRVVRTASKFDMHIYTKWTNLTRHCLKFTVALAALVVWHLYVIASVSFWTTQKSQFMETLHHLPTQKWLIEMAMISMWFDRTKIEQCYHYHLPWTALVENLLICSYGLFCSSVPFVENTRCNVLLKSSHISGRCTFFLIKVVSRPSLGMRSPAPMQYFLKFFLQFGVPAHADWQHVQEFGVAANKYKLQVAKYLEHFIYAYMSGIYQLQEKI